MASTDKKTDKTKRPPEPSSIRGASSNASSVTETDLAQDKMGNNQLQGNDQEDVRNQRHAQPGTKTRTDSVVESLEKLDKDVRANAILAKAIVPSGARTRGGNPGYTCLNRTTSETRSVKQAPIFRWD